VLPEYHLTSWAPEHPDFISSCTASIAYLPRYRALAQELAIHIVPGTIIEPRKKPAEPGAASDTADPVFELCNMTYFIAASTGDILSTYQKRNLWQAERGVLATAQSTPHKAFEVPFPANEAGGLMVRVGMLICWDLAYPEAFRELVADGAQLVIIPAYWCIDNINPKLLALNQKSEVAFLDSVTVARAYENACIVAFCNSHGQSQVAMPILGSLGKLGLEEGMMVSEVDLDVLQVAEDHYGLRADLQGEAWHYAPRKLSK
jgi:predicted amidohydrolase